MSIFRCRPMGSSPARKSARLRSGLPWARPTRARRSRSTARAVPTASRLERRTAGRRTTSRRARTRTGRIDPSSIPSPRRPPTRNGRTTRSTASCSPRWLNAASPPPLAPTRTPCFAAPALTSRGSRRRKTRSPPLTPTPPPARPPPPSPPRSMPCSPAPRSASAGDATGLMSRVTPNRAAKNRTSITRTPGATATMSSRPSTKTSPTTASSPSRSPATCFPPPTTSSAVKILLPLVTSPSAPKATMRGEMRSFRWTSPTSNSTPPLRACSVSPSPARVATITSSTRFRRRTTTPSRESSCRPTPATAPSTRKATTIPPSSSNFRPDRSCRSDRRCDPTNDPSSPWPMRARRHWPPRRRRRSTPRAPLGPRARNFPPISSSRSCAPAQRKAPRKTSRA